MKTQSIDVELKDMSGEGEPLKAAISVDEYGISIKLNGYGTAAAAPGFGDPVHIELYGGKPVVYIWDDINVEDPTHKITLEGAREELFVELK